MSDDVMDISVQLIYALGAWERGEPGAEARHHALRERLKRIAAANRGEDMQPCRTHLRLVYSDGSDARTRPDGAAGARP